MARFFMSKRALMIACMAFSLAGMLCAAAHADKKPKITKAKAQPAKKDDTKDSAEPDKVLYERALASIKKAHYDEGRLDFQTLINTYPDSEYLAKAKLGVADSFYKEGGTSSLTQAIEEYKNFIVFFPFLDEAAYAQMQVGMAHYKLMEKADRDNSHAEAAEDEFRTFLLKYPQSPFVPQAEQSMRNVQEVLAQGEFGIGRFYYLKKDYRASAARLAEVTDRYPLFSESDQALWMLGDVYERAKQTVKNEDAKNHFADLAAKCYDRIVQDYPSSRLAPAAKAQLKAMNMPIPAPSPDAVARMKQQQLYAKEHHQLAVVKMPMGMLKSTPDLSAAARSGAPNLNPPDDLVSATEVLNPNPTGTSLSIRAAGASTGSEGGTASTADSESVETESTDSSASSTAPAEAAPTTTTSVQILEAPGAGAATTPAPADSGAPAPTDVPAPPPANATPETANPPAATEVVAGAAPAAVEAAATPSAAPATATTASTASQSGTSTAQASSAGSTATSGTQAQASASDPKTESTSKKKKGLHKIIPF